MKFIEVRNHLVLAAMALHERRLWERFTNFHCLAVTWPGLANPVLVTIMGNAGEEYGLQMLRGPLAYEGLLSLQRPDFQGDDLIDSLDLLGFSLSRFSKLDSEQKGWIRKAGLTCKTSDQVPVFLAKAPGCRVLLPDNEEIRELFRIINAVIAAADQDLLEPTEPIDPNGICWLTLNNDLLDPLESVSRQAWSDGKSDKTIAFPQQRPDLSDLPRHNSTWLVGWLDAAVGIQGDNRSTKLLLVVDADNEMVLHHDIHFADQMEKAVTSLFTFMKTGLPNQMLCSSRKLFDVTTPILEQAKIKCEFQASIPLLQDLMAHFQQFMMNAANDK